MNHRKNKHYQKTDSLIRQTALRMIKSHLTLSVAEICRQCAINRTTFYAHYVDLPDLLERIQEDIFGDFMEETLRREDVALMSYQSFELFARHVRNHMEFYELYFKSNRTFPLQDGLEQLWNETIVPYYHERGIVDEQIMQLRFVCVQAGFTITLGKWVEQGCQPEPEEVAKILSECLSL